MRLRGQLVFDVAHVGVELIEPGVGPGEAHVGVAPQLGDLALRGGESGFDGRDRPFHELANAFGQVLEIMAHAAAPSDSNAWGFVLHDGEHHDGEH